MNAAERLVDGVHPRISAELRLLKMRLAGHPTVRTTVKVIERSLAAGDMAVDIGARRGVYTVLMSRLVGPGGRVHAIEPFASSVAALGRLHRSNVTVHPVALSDHGGIEDLYVPLEDGRPLDALASLTPPDGPNECVRIELVTLDALLGGASPPRLIKCDAEGHEHDVLRGAERTLGEHMPVLVVSIEQRHQADSIQRTLRHLHDLDYNGFFMRSGVMHPVEEFDVARDQLAFLTDSFLADAVPRGYVHRFVFLPPGNGLEGLT